MYFQIISNRQTSPLLLKEYGEHHHILPKSLGGLDHNNNIVKLSAREHFICHLLLTKMVNGQSLYKMKTAFIAMSNFQNRWHHRYNSRLFEKSKQGLIFTIEHRNKISEAARRQFANPDQRLKASEAAKKRPPVSDKTKMKMKESSKKRNLTPELRAKFSTSAVTWKGRKHKELTCKKISESHKGKPNGASLIVLCPYCGKYGFARGMNGYHFEKCKFKISNSSS